MWSFSFIKTQNNVFQCLLKNIKLRIFFSLITLLTAVIDTNQVSAQSASPVDTVTVRQERKALTQKKKSLKITTLTYGGTGLLFTRVGNHSTIMNGGRGSATFNNRYTFGGAGWGMPKGVELDGLSADTFSFVKMGYGGLEFGYIMLQGKKMNLGTSLLVAGGAVFKETLPKTKESGFRMFPVLEPSVYSQISTGKLFRIDVGVSYRFISGTKLSYIPDKNLRGFSLYVVLLVGTCNCK
jgi:hypothetical protein